jgi:hypothetical protein
MSSFRIIENKTRDTIFYTARQSWSTLGWLLRCFDEMSPPASWLGYNSDMCYHEENAEKFSTVEGGHARS